MSFIPVNEPLLKGNEKKYLNECIDTGWISSEGRFVKKFEEDFSTYIGSKYGISVCNGTAALDIALKSLDFKEGDEVLAPSFTIISCLNAIIKTGAKPVLIDSDPNTWCMDVNLIEEKITNKTKAIMVVHIFGLSVDMDPVIQLAKKYKLKIIEDAAECHGLEYKGKKCGSFGDVSIFSFYSNKIITTGEGGMILTNDKAIADKCASYRNLCFKPEQRFVHEEMGWNYRMSNLQAAVGVAQLEQIEFFIKRKREIGALYNKLLSGIDNIILPLGKTQYCQNIYWVYGVVLKLESGYNAKQVMAKLADCGVGTRPFFYPMNIQPVYNNMGLFINESHPVSENLAQMGFYIPSGLSVTNEQIEKVSGILKEILQ